MRLSIVLIVLAGLSLGLSGCEEAPPAPPPDSVPAPVPLPTPKANAAAAAVTVPPATPPAAPIEIPERLTPEDIDIDPARDPQMREKAKSLNAISIAEMKNLKAGANVVVLVRADKGGGTIYGSGPYTADSALRKAVVHAGLLKDRELGIVRLKYLVHEEEHPGTPAHGITPTAWGKYHLSYTVEAIAPE